jgi:hypothetical protein
MFRITATGRNETSRESKTAINREETELKLGEGFYWVEAVAFRSVPDTERTQRIVFVVGEDAALLFRRAAQCRLEARTTYRLGIIQINGKCNETKTQEWKDVINGSCIWW